MTAAAIARILVVDDEKALMTALCNTLEREGYATTGYTSARSALAHLAERQYDLLLTDLMMPEMDGIALLREAQVIDGDLAAVVMTGHGTIDTAVKALKTGAVDYVLKPFRLDNLLAVLGRALAMRQLQTENIRLREAVSIYELARAISHGLEHDEIVQRTLCAAQQQNNAHSVCVLVTAADRCSLRVATATDRELIWSSDAPIALTSPIEAWVATTREQLANWDGSSPVPAVTDHPFTAVLKGIAIPVVSGGDLHGVLGFNSRTPQHPLTPGQIKSLDILARTAASAFEAESLLTELRGMNRELEQRVLARTRELEVSNADLESFSYSVSHDLRAPLHAIDGFCQIFLADHGTGLSAEGRGLLDKVCAGVTRMHRLIDDLLHLARFSRQPLETQRVGVRALVRRVAAQLEHQIGSRDVQLTVRDLPDCLGDESLLEHVFTNLLSNAYKFTQGRASARITVDAFLQGAEQVYLVRDNGVGFDMKYADKLFGVFQRLHSQADFAGTGIGLSIVQRIVTRHGGRVWAESRLQEGTTVYFSLPRTAEAQAA